MKRAFKKQYDFIVDSEKYLIFLKEHFTKVKPQFVSIISKQLVHTTNGNMYMITVANAIENPNYEVAAHCMINGESVFLWKDHCWTIAVNKHGEEIRFTNAGSVSNTFLIYKIGIDPVE